MKLQNVIIALAVVIILGIGVFIQVLIKQEEKQDLQGMASKGKYLVSLVATHSIKDFKGDRRDFFLKTLAEYTSSEGLIYCFISDQEGNLLVSLAPEGQLARIPEEIATRSLNTIGLTEQTYMDSQLGLVIYEFSKPIYEDGQRTATVRLGFRLPQISLFSLERISLVGMIVLLIFAGALFVYYVITLAMRPIIGRYHDQDRPSFSSSAINEELAKKSGITRVIGELDHLTAQFRDKIDKIDTENVMLASKVGVLSFEKNQLINVLNNVTFGIIVTDIHDNISHINDYSLNLLNLKRDQVLDRPVSEALNNREVESFLLQRDTAEHGRAASYLETSFPELAPGETFKVSLSYLKDTEGAPIGRMISISNISGEILAEKTKHEFIAHVAHELKTPLATIRSYNEMLMEDEIQDEEMKKEFYNTINDETQRLARLINNLLDFSKIEMGSLTLEKGLVLTDWLYNDCLAAIEAPALEQNITIEREVPDNFPSLVGDKELIKVAIINILNNAVKYTPKNGTIRFSLIDQDNQVIFEVTDTGYGIAEEDLPHIFEQFYRSGDQNVSEQSGSGLGLAITREIINLHGGEIEVRSTLGQGSHFTIRIPKEEYHLGKQESINH